MVYRGKPSKACLPCRRRRLICDLKEDGCSQCRRADILCHGYRDTESLLVKDESSSTKRRVQGNIKSKPKPKLKPPASRHDLVPIFRYAGAIPQSLSIPMASQAKDLFYHNYVVGILKPFDFVETICSPTSTDEHLTKSMDAVALAYLNYQRHAPNAQTEARQSYITALQLMNKALQDPEVAKRDSTMLASLLLDLYEKITSQQPAYEGACAPHLQGALMLASLRGDEQFYDPISMRMLARVITNGIISSVTAHRPIPNEITALRTKLAAHTHSFDPKARDSDLMIEFAALKSRLESGTISDDVAIASIKGLDERISMLFLSVPREWGYKTIYVEEGLDHHWEAYHHIYPTEQLAQMWNALRLARMLLNEMILRYTITDGSSHFTTTSLKQQATETIQSMTSGICASVPQFIGDLLFTNVSNKSANASSRSSIKNPTGPNPTHHLPCYRLIYPLYVAAQSGVSPAPLRQWIVSHLRFMADYHGIPNAARVAEILESGQWKEPWLVYAMLGSYAFVC